jgi:hypothetical protein
VPIPLLIDLFNCSRDEIVPKAQASFRLAPNPPILTKIVQKHGFLGGQNLLNLEKVEARKDGLVQPSGTIPEIHPVLLTLDSCTTPQPQSTAPPETRQRPDMARKPDWGEELNEFLTALDAYNPTFPEATAAFHLEKSGLAVKDERIPKLVSLAADRLLSEIIHEAKQISILRQQSVRSQKRKLEMSETLEMVDVEASLVQSKVFLRGRRARTED